MKSLSQAALGAFLLSVSALTTSEARISATNKEGRELVVEATDLSMVVNEEIKLIPNIPVDYDQGQKKSSDQDPVLSDDGLSFSLSGNRWVAFALPGDGFDITQDTVLEVDFLLEAAAEFQAICMDFDLELTGANGKCFVLRTDQGWITNMINVPSAGQVNQTTHFSIPVGHFLEGNVKYLILIQDNDAVPTVGRSTFSNLELHEDPRNTLHIEVDDAITYVANDQHQYRSDDTASYIMDVSEDGKSVQVNGDQLKAFALENPIDITETTMLSFDYVLENKKDFHAICLDEDSVYNTLGTSSGKGDRCFVISNTQSGLDKMYPLQNRVQTPSSESHHIVIPVGQFVKGYTARYIAFLQDNDTSDKSTGMSTWSNIKIYREDRVDPIIEINDVMETVPLVQEPYSIDGASKNYMDQDTREYYINVSDDGKELTQRGNQWKAIPLLGTFEVTPATMLEFDFNLVEQVEVHAICLDDDNVLKVNGQKSCFVVSRTQGVSNMVDLSDKATPSDPIKHYTIPIGSHFTGNVTHIAFIQDYDPPRGVPRDEGVSVWSNIEIYNRPDLKITVNGNERIVPNHQVSYDRNQDHGNRLLHVTQDGLSVRMTGNVWKAFQIPIIDVTPNTVLQFDFSAEEDAESYAVCLDEDLELGDSTAEYDTRCFALGGRQDSDGNFYDPPKKTYVAESRTYMIRLGDIFHGVSGGMNYLVFIQDEDEDRSKGLSTVSNIAFFEASSCLKDVGFDLFMDECSTDNFVAEIETVLSQNSANCGTDGWAELLAFFDVTYRSQVVDEIGSICSSAYEANYLPFSETAGHHHYQFLEEYFDGGNQWHYEREETNGDAGVLSKDAGRLEVINREYAQVRGLSWPDHIHNFETCELRAAMCCWVSDRTDCGTEESCADADPDDNSDVCYVDFTRSQRSAHVRDGYSIYGNKVEGNLNCAGFAWGNEVGHTDNALKGNALFHVAMHESLYGRGLVEQIPGAPLCGCAEKMPTVTRADCTELVVDQSIAINYDAAITEFTAKVTINDISYQNCTGAAVDNDLSSYYQSLVDQGKAMPREAEQLGEILVGEGNCGQAIGDFLSTKGFAFPA